MFQRVISCVAAFWMQRKATLSTEKSSFFHDIFSHTNSTFSCWCFIIFLWVEYGPVCDSLVSHQTCQGGHFWGARFRGVGVGVLLEPCDSSDDDDDGDDTASDVCIRFSVISDMKSRNDLRELGLFFEKVT